MSTAESYAFSKRTTSSSVGSSRPSSPPPANDIVVVKQAECLPPEDSLRAVHRIRLSALEHNYACVESAANRQRCSVITVVKADGYGHGAIATALHLADNCGADSFAVATLEEAIALRRALENNPPGRWSKQLASLFHTGGVDSATTSTTTAEVITVISPLSSPDEATARIMRPSQIRIIVLGPPVGFPRCFDDYYHYGIEVMVSGPEVAAALLQWAADEKERKRSQVERAAMESKAKALTAPLAPRDAAYVPTTIVSEEKKEKDAAEAAATTSPSDSPKTEARKMLRHPSSTLGNVSGQDLAREVRTILMNQKAAAEAANHIPTQVKSTPGSTTISTAPSEASLSDQSAASDPQRNKPCPKQPPVKPNKPPGGAAQVFGGIEALAKTSRARELVAARASSVFTEDSSDAPISEQTNMSSTPVTGTRKRLRWHALVDSGMGRLGFRTEEVKKDDTSGIRDTVDILQEMLQAEIHLNAPIEFYGMCTHMAEASATSDYTNSQIAKFIKLLKRVREASILIPTVSTDNSAALLTENLTHFDASAILSQPLAPTRGYVRTGGAIYGQRPAFKQLKAVSTLLASVRHVAVLAKGETVGYDRAYEAKYDVRIATLTIGFADGYPRELGNGAGSVQIRGAVFPVAGNVCMDMLMVELGPAEDKDGVGATVRVGDTAVLWGPVDEHDREGMVRLQDIAATLKTTQSALTCGLDKIRVRREFE